MFFYMLLPLFSLCFPLTCCLSFVSRFLFTGTWLRRTWRTQPSGWERASAPQCLLCWASLCTEHFSSSGDQTAWDINLLLSPSVDSGPSFLPERLKRLAYQPTRPIASAPTPPRPLHSNATWARNKWAKSKVHFIGISKWRVSFFCNFSFIFCFCWRGKGQIIFEITHVYQPICKCWISVICWSTVVQVRHL